MREAKVRSIKYAGGKGKALATPLEKLAYIIREGWARRWFRLCYRYDGKVPQSLEERLLRRLYKAMQMDGLVSGYTMFADAAQKLRQLVYEGGNMGFH